MTLSEYSKPNRVGYTNQQGSSAVRVSFVTMPDPSGNGEKICFNIGRELYVYIYKGVKKAPDLNKPIDKKMYKGTYPTCHDFNKVTMTVDSISLLIGFSTGQIQLIDPIKKEPSKLYNEERFIDKTKITCIKWVPNSPNLFLVSHSSGQLYVYNDQLPCGSAPPHYQLFKQGDGFVIHTCKTKSTRNPLFRWVIGEGCLNEFAFSPCGRHLAVVSQDGFLRVFNYDKMELLGVARSYFGGFLCVCWSPDGRYVVVGGEDDLVTVWSFHERRVVARGQGHRSWVSVVAFDPHTTTTVGPDSDANEFSAGSDDECGGGGIQQQNHSLHNHHNHVHHGSATRTKSASSPAVSSRGSADLSRINATCYRLGSVGQDTQLCLWDITEDVLKQPVTKSRTCIGAENGGSGLCSAKSVGGTSGLGNSVGSSPADTSTPVANGPISGSSAPSLSQRLAGLGFGDRRDHGGHKRNFSLTSRASGATGGGSEKNSNPGSRSGRSSLLDDPMKLIGTSACPRFDECPVLEPLVCKKIAHERLSALVFREDCFVTACHDGYVYTWARPGKMVGNSSSIV
ncbi:hypothetical protein B566_EDAN002256 [Ephemera danica]|nr:hypothetical protein B566_EDAN002256 [Ephemera danica]